MAAQSHLGLQPTALQGTSLYNFSLTLPLPPPPISLQATEDDRRGLPVPGGGPPRPLPWVQLLLRGGDCLLVPGQDPFRVQDQEGEAGRGLREQQKD